MLIITEYTLSPAVFMFCKILKQHWFIVKQKSPVILYGNHTILMFLKICDKI